jgi:signal transduction histidine kinase
MADRPAGSRVPLAPATLAQGLAWITAGCLSLLLLPAGLVTANALNLLNTLLFAQAGWMALRRSRGSEQSRSTWRYLAAAFFVQMIAQGYALGFALKTGRIAEFPSVGDFAALATLALMGLGFAAWPRRHRTGSEPLQKSLDALGMGLSLVFLGWGVALEPLFRPTGIPLLLKVANLLFLTLTASILGFVFYLALDQWGRLRGTLGWLGAAFIAALAQILIQVPLGLAGAYYLGHPVDLLVVLAGVFMLMATLDPADPADHTSSGWAGWLNDRTLSLMGPALPTLLCLPLGLGFLIFNPARWDRALIALGTALSCLMVVRMVLALKDLRAFSQDLDRRVRERTRDLEEAQDLLLRTERLNGLASLGAGLAHDLKNLLGVMKNYAVLVGQDLEEGRPIQPADLQAIQQAAEQAGTLANQLMAFGREEVERETAYDLGERLKHLISMLRAALPAYISLEVRLPPGPLVLPGDPTRMDQVIVNLVLNARDAIDGSGRILVEAQPCTLAGERPGALLVVSDSGCGMSEEVQAKIFDPFFTTKPLGTGTGLGLASVRSLLQIMEGEIEVHSVVGRGTTFLLRLPLA